MQNEVWSRMAQFLKELRCENTGRDSYLELPEYKTALKNKSQLCTEYEETVQKIQGTDRKKIERYVDAVEICAEEENQQAYVQGIVDCILILAGMGIFSREEQVMEIIFQLKQKGIK